MHVCVHVQNILDSFAWCFVQLWEDEPSTDEASSPVHDAADDDIAANGAADDTTLPADDAEQAADSNGDEVAKYDADESVEDASAGAASVPDGAEQASSCVAVDGNSDEVNKYDADADPHQSIEDASADDTTVPADDAQQVSSHNGDEVKCDDGPHVSLEDAIADDTTVPDGDAQQASSCLAADSNGDEVAECDGGHHESVEDASEHVADERREQQCLMSLDDDVDLSGSVPDMDVAESDAEKHEDRTEGDTPPDSQRPLEADDAALGNDASIKEM